MNEHYLFFQAGWASSDITPEPEMLENFIIPRTISPD